ncbi:MAG TPA: aminotransferase class V-fold PLP-dependent enzyme [Bacteroidales bacterium]|nr:aminotransferase class V-fold PLP-dependent enzyme [Bacteroidales bacterium]
MERRDIIKSLAVLPFAGSFLPLESVLGSAKGPLAAGAGNIYQSIGVEPVINCVGTFTIIGGSLERPEVVSAMHDASGSFVQYDELAFGVGRRLAEITGAEWGMVSAGCAAGMKHVTSACVTGGNPEKLIRIPDLRGFDKTEVVIPRSSRNQYDHSIRNIGVTIITVETPEELDRALNSRTAMIYLNAGGDTEPGGPFDLEKISAMAKPFNIPVLVDAAAEDLTIPNVHLQRGATVVAYSGGKALCGPQCAGLLLGRKDILMSAWQASSPHHGTGRDNKVGKEEMLGMLAAVEAWIKRDHVEKMKTWHTYLDNITKRVSSVNGTSFNVREPKGLSNHSPSLIISWSFDKFNVTGQEVAEELATGKPRIAVHSSYIDESGNTSISISTGQMQPGNDKVVADRIVEVLSQKHTKKEMAAPVANLSGRWDVDIEFFSSKSRHTFFIEQDGNWIQGSHKGDFTLRDMVGILDGDQVKLSSSERLPGDNVNFVFHGTASNDKMTGQIYLGEYINAKFTATRHEQKPSHRPIRVPKGQPLSS